MYKTQNETECPYPEGITDVSTASESEIISISDAVSLFAEDVLVEMSNDFKHHAFDKFINEHHIQFHKSKTKRTASNSKINVSQRFVEFSNKNA